MDGHKKLGGDVSPPGNNKIGQPVKRPSEKEGNMIKSTVIIETRKKDNGTVTAENSYIYTPKTQFAGGSIKWYEDKVKTVKTSAA